MQFAQYFPITEWLPKYNRSDLTPDIIAGLTVWALVVPQSIAYAQIAGLPPQAGIFASFAAPLGYAISGTSRQLICSPTSATAALSASLVAPVVASQPEDYRAMSAALAILCGLGFILLGKLKLGFISQFIASAVQTGFLFGLGLTIIIGQLFKVFGFDGIDGPFYKQAWYFVKHLDETSGWTLVIGGATFAAVFLLGKLMPKLPAALLLVVISIVVVSLFDLNDKGVAVVGSVDRAIPLPALPIVDLRQLLKLVPGVFAIVIVGYSESISVAKRFAEEHEYQIRPNQELAALGISTAFGGFFQSFITAGGASQSAANDRAGAKTQMSGIVLALLAALTSIALMPLFKDLPLAVLSAIVINAVMGFVSIPALRRVHALRRESFIFSLIALIGVLVLGILPGLLIAVALSVVLLLGRFGRPDTLEVAPIPGANAVASIVNNPGISAPEGMMILRPALPLLFVNASWIRDDVNAQIDARESVPRVVVFDLETTSDLDVTDLDVLAGLQRDLARKGAQLWLTNVRADVRAMLDRGELTGAIGQDRIFLSVADAVAAYDPEPGSAQVSGVTQ